MTRVLEGTWEEIEAHKDEWRGQRLRIEVLEAKNGNGANVAEEVEDGPTLADLMGDLIGSVKGLPPDLGARSEAYFAQAMDEKQGRKLD